MRLDPGGGRAALLGYSANVHPGASLDHLERALDAAGAVREHLGSARMGLGLWLSRSALGDVAGWGGAARLADELARRGLEVFSMNGFPFGDFHAPVVKRAVYHPDWTTRERRDYTLDVAALLAALLPDDLDQGTVSTLPLGHRGELGGAGAADFTARALDRLCRLAADLARLRDSSGKRIQVCLEPEPGCLLESTGDAVRLWREDLPAAAARTGVAPDLLAEHLGLCFDCCHQAVGFEQAADSLGRLDAAGVPLGKVQLSSALIIAEPGSPAGRAALARFAEPRFLHQVRAQGPGGQLFAADDLAEVGELPRDRPWRVHFHVPIHRPVVGEVATTRDFLEDAVAALRRRPGALPHLEVETYTWSVLPEGERPGDDAALAAGIAAEMAWAAAELTR